MLPEEFGQYTLLERLGYGGMAEVFLARTTSASGFAKLLAIKRLLPHCVEDQDTIDLLADEARIAVELVHANIVQVFDFGRVEKTYYLAMEFVDGVDLKSLIEIDDEHSTPLPLDVALRVTISVLDGLNYAHQRKGADGTPLGIIHRDVTPHNVMVSRRGQVKLMDFGVARARISSHVSVVGDIRGKFSYMPPEQACGGEIDQRVDIFAAGAILYELLSGRQPFRSTDSGEQMKLLSRDIAPPSHLVPQLPPELDGITATALHSDPKGRFATAKGFADALRDQLLAHCGRDTSGAIYKLSDLVERRLHERRQDNAHQLVGADALLMSGQYAVSPAHSLIADGAISLRLPEKTLAAPASPEDGLPEGFAPPEPVGSPRREPIEIPQHQLDAGNARTVAAADAASASSSFIPVPPTGAGVDTQQVHREATYGGHGQAARAQHDEPEPIALDVLSTAPRRHRTATNPPHVRKRRAEQSANGEFTGKEQFASKWTWIAFLTTAAIGLAILALVAF